MSSRTGLCLLFAALGATALCLAAARPALAQTAGQAKVTGSAKAAQPTGAEKSADPAQSHKTEPKKPDDPKTSKPKKPDEEKSTDTKPPDQKPANETKPADPKELEAKWAKVNWEELAKTDQLAFLQKVQQKCQETVTDYDGTFFKQERIEGKLRDPEAAHMKWRNKPFSVYMKYTQGDKGREVIYVDGQNDNQIVAHPGGALGGLIQVKVDPLSERAMKDNLRPITMAGIINMMNSIVPQFELAQKNGDLKVQYLGKMEIGGRKTYAIKRVLPQKDPYPCKELVMFIDVEALIPVGADSYGWDGQLWSKYRYTDFKLNTGLKDEDFDPKNKDYNF